MGLFNDDRLAGQFKLRTDFLDIWDRHRLGQLKFRMELNGQARSSAGGCKLTRSLSQLQARPPILQAYCVCAFRALARSLIPAETLPPTCPNFFRSFFFEGTVFFERAERPNATRSARIPRLRRAIRAPLQTSDAWPQFLGTRLD
jgi:hypothetical protein